MPKLYKYGKVPTATTQAGWEKLIDHEMRATNLPRTKTQTYRKYYNIRGKLIKGIKDNLDNCAGTKGMRQRTSPSPSTLSLGSNSSRESRETLSCQGFTC